MAKKSWLDGLDDIKDEHGFIKGTKSSLVAALMVEGTTRQADLAAEAAKRHGGDKKAWSATVSEVKRVLVERGYTTEQTFRMVPPTKTPAKKAPARKTTTVKVAAKSTRKAPVKRAKVTKAAA